MNGEDAVFQLWIFACLVIAAFFTTTFPLLYLFSTWNKSKLGRVLMLQGVAFALAVDLTLLFALWTPPMMAGYIVSAGGFTLIAISSGTLTWMLWRSNHSKWSLRRSKQKE